MWASLESQATVNCIVESTANETPSITQAELTKNESAFAKYDVELRALFAKASSIPQAHHAHQKERSRGQRIVLDCSELLKLLSEHHVLDYRCLRQRDVELLFNQKKPKYERKIDYSVFLKILAQIAIKIFGQTMNERDAEFALVARLFSHPKSPTFYHASPKSFYEGTPSPRQAYRLTNENASVFERLSDKQFFPLSYKQQHPGNSTPRLSMVSPCSQKSQSNTSKQSLNQPLPPVFERLTSVQNYVGIHKKLALLKLAKQVQSNSRTPFECI